MDEFARQYGITFRDRRLLKLALTHRSYLHVTGQGPRESNERLEFLGDSVLGLVTSEFLYRSHPGEHEGQLTKTKSLLVSKAILSRRALAMGLGRFVFMSHSEVESGGRQRLSILADAFESVIGAIYLDQGFESARAFIQRWLLKDSPVIVADKRHTNYKSHLQEYVQSTFRTHPVYRIRSEMGPDHSKQFMVEVMVGRRVLGEGRGRNKKEAEQAAARNALERVENGPLSDRETRRSERQPGREGSGPAERTAVESPRATPGGAADDSEPGEEGGRRRRRRGRRGGRGRRERMESGGLEPGDEPRVTEGETPRQDRPAGEREVRSEPRERPERREPDRREAPMDRPGRPRTEPRDRPERAALPPRPAEVEPLPPAHEEDENEEVGRPEGPLEERHVDPYAWAPPAEPRTPARERAPVGPAVPEAGAAQPVPRDDPFAASPEVADPGEREPEVSEPESLRDETPGETAAEEEPPRAESGSSEGRSGEDEDDYGPRYPETSPPPPPPPAPNWGRRARRR